MNDGGVCGPVCDCNRLSMYGVNGEIDLHVPYASDFSPITPVIESGDLLCGVLRGGPSHATCVQEMFPQGECCMFNFGVIYTRL